MLTTIKNTLKDASIVEIETLQSLWSGYGKIIRVRSIDKNLSYIVKQVSLATQPSRHPRGWNTSNSHQRKLKSYQIESIFYQRYAPRTNLNCRVPNLLGFHSTPSELLFVLEDLDASGYDARSTDGDWLSVKQGISWLAHFHARFMDDPCSELWSQGGYWHLDTRKDEFDIMPESKLKRSAHNLDQQLKSAKYQTLIHGDAKMENMCFDLQSEQVAFVDFQYAGRGAGVIDLAYFVGSAFNDEQLHTYHSNILNEYLTQLEKALLHYQPSINFAELAQEYQFLYPIAWADFYRFLQGWNPQSWKVNTYMDDIANKAINSMIM